MTPARRKTYVYFLTTVEGGAIKIGCSYLPLGRLRSMLCWSPEPLKILATAPGTQSDERFLHSMFAADRMHSEWFRPSARLLDMIDRVKASGALDQQVVQSLPIPPAGFTIVLRTAAVLAKHKITWADLAAEAGVKEISVRRWAAHIPATRIGWFIDCMAKRGIVVAAEELYEMVPLPERESYPQPKPINSAGLDYVHAQIDKHLRGGTHCERKRIPDLQKTADALHALLPTTFWPKRKEIAKASGISVHRTKRLLQELQRMGLIRVGTGWHSSSIAFALLIEEYWPADRPKFKAAA